jgi:hypothetical protein
MLRKFVRATIATAMVTTLGFFVNVSVSGAATSPSGQVMYGNTSFDSTQGRFVGGGGTVEPAYDDTTGTVIYLQTPNQPPIHNPKRIDPVTGLPVNVAPIYLPVYPVGSGIDPASLNCAHAPADNCPDHGPAVAGAAMGTVPGVYGGGVLGHDHLVGIASTGGDFNVIWEPVLVLFTNSQAAKQHITTLNQITAALAANQVMEVQLPQLDFHCSAVSAAAYQRGIPAPTVIGP